MTAVSNGVKYLPTYSSAEGNLIISYLPVALVSISFSKIDKGTQIVRDAPHPDASAWPYKWTETQPSSQNFQIEMVVSTTSDRNGRQRPLAMLGRGCR